MIDATHISFLANDRSYFSLIKKEIHQLALTAGISQLRINGLDLIVAEMTSNLYKYSDDGEILLGVFSNGGSPYIEVICIDNGPGIKNASRMIQDGMSTSKTLGHGLGSIKRLSDTFEIYSQVGWGTILLSRLYNDPGEALSSSPFVVRAIVVAKPGETLSGDGISLKKTSRNIKLMIADGLGHGPEANTAINSAAAAFQSSGDSSPAATLATIHSQIRKTRGAVITILGYEYASKRWSIAGVGNIMTFMVGPQKVRAHLSSNGIVGCNLPEQLQDQHYALVDYNQIILCSDGIKSRIDLQKYPQISDYDMSIFAAAIYKDYALRNDDMSIVMAKYKSND